MSESTKQTCVDEERDEEVDDPALRRIQEDRLPGEIETGMMTGSDESGISATERFEGEMTREEALQALAPEGAETPPQPPEAARE